MDSKDNEQELPQWHLDAQLEGELAYREARANGASLAEATRISKKTYGRARGRAASRGEITAIEAEAKWVAQMMFRKQAGA